MKEDDWTMSDQQANRGRAAKHDFERGRQAFLAGESMETNPYIKGQNGHLRWAQGFVQAKGEAAAKKKEEPEEEETREAVVSRLPGMEIPPPPRLTKKQFAEIREAAETYRKARDTRMRWTTKEVESRESLQALLNHYGQTVVTYESDKGELLDAAIESETKEKVKVRPHREDEPTKKDGDREPGEDEDADADESEDESE